MEKTGYDRREAEDLHICPLDRGAQDIRIYEDGAGRVGFTPGQHPEQSAQDPWRQAHRVAGYPEPRKEGESRQDHQEPRQERARQK